MRIKIYQYACIDTSVCTTSVFFSCVYNHADSSILSFTVKENKFNLKENYLVYIIINILRQKQLHVQPCSEIRRVTGYLKIATVGVL